MLYTDIADCYELLLVLSLTKFLTVISVITIRCSVQFLFYLLSFIYLVPFNVVLIQFKRIHATLVT